MLWAVGPAGYTAGLWAASLADGRALDQTVCFDPAAASHFAATRLIISTLTAVGAVLFLFAAPWLLGTLAIGRMESKRATAGAWSLAANTAALVLVCLLLRNSVGVGRGGFFVAWLAWNTVLLLLARPPAPADADLRRLGRRWGGGLLIGAATVMIGIVLFHGEYFVQCFNGDGTEFRDLAQSLRLHFLPYWEIEPAERFGTFIANPTVANSYWTLALQLLLGEGELATRLPGWIWWLGVFVVSLRMVQGEDRRAAWLPAVPLALALMLGSVWYTFYVGYYPYMADPAAQAVTDALFTLFLLLGWDCLRHGDTAGWIVSTVLATLVFYAGLVMFVLMTAAALVWQPVPRRQVLHAALAGTLVFVVIACGYLLVGWSEGSLAGWRSTWHREIFRKYATAGPGNDSALLYVGYFLLGCGGIPAIGLLRPLLGRNADPDLAWKRTMATVTVLYLLIILGSGHKNLHYLGPLLPIPVILWLKHPQGASPSAAGRWAVPLSAAGCLAGCIFLCWPASRPEFTLNRELGAVTTFQTDSYQQACRWGRIASELYDRGHVGWQIGEHTWASYSQRDARPAAPRPLVVTDGVVPATEYQLVFESAKGVKLYCRDSRTIRWAASRRPPAGPDRSAAVFRPIAVAPRLRLDIQP